MEKYLLKCRDNIQAIDDFCDVYNKTKCLRNDKKLRKKYELLMDLREKVKDVMILL